ncbi:hypothetical protein GGI03_005317 [Coemansia sp. RSA 2337]|nr:hypothetical protein GGH13_000953 [Coemansia sp. S155-1]KAJ2460319.1 hypothetical protein GGI03_005317 [Coemansia sp. RSA 2337]
MADDPPLQLDHTENEPYNCDIESVKVPLDAVEWRPEFKEALEKLVLTVHCLVVHTYQLAWWTFVFEPLQTPDFNHRRFMDQMYFYYVFMALAEYKSRGKRKKAKDERKTGKGKGKCKHGKGRTEKSITYKSKELITKHIDAYCVSAQYSSKDYKSMSSIAKYVCREVFTAYAVNIKQRYGQRLRYAINSSLHTHQREKEMRAEMEKRLHTDSEIRAKCEEQIWAPARALKENIQLHMPTCYVHDSDGNLKKDDNGDYIIDEDRQRAVDELAPARPAEHLHSFSKLCQLIETRNQGVRKKKGRNKKANSVRCFPLRKTFVPCHMRLDAVVIRQHILPDEPGLSKLGPMDIWRRVVNLDAKPFKKCGDKEFSGSACTDGVSISLTFKTQEVREKSRKRAAKGAATRAAKAAAARAAKRQVNDDDNDDVDDGAAATNDGAVGGFVVYNGLVPTDVETRFTAIAADVVADVGTGAASAAGDSGSAKKKWTKKKLTDDCKYINDLTKEEHERHKGRNVFDDMGRRDEHFFMHKNSTPENPVVMRYTYCQESKERRTRKFRKIRSNVKRSFPGNNIQKAENRLAKYDGTSLIADKFKAYVEAHAREGPLLSEFYSKTPTKHDKSTHQIKKDKPESYTPKTYPLFRKLKLSAYINKQQADSRLVKNIRKKFSMPLKPDDSDELTILGEPGEPSIKRGDPRVDPVINMGNWSASMVKYQEPIRGKSWRSMLKRYGLPVFLVNEFRTSCICPKCNSPLEKFLDVDNPRPQQRKKRPRVLCHGLLRCTNQNCLKTVAVNTDMDVDGAGGNVMAKNADAAKKAAKGADDKTSRKFNRNMAAVLNFRRILVSLRETGDIPEKFKRGTPKDIAAKNRPRDSGAVTVGSASTAKQKPMRKQPPSKRLKKA